MTFIFFLIATSSFYARFLQVFKCSDGVQIEMLSIQCSVNKVNDYVNKAVDHVFTNNNELITLDPRKECIDKDQGVKAIKGAITKKTL